MMRHLAAVMFTDIVGYTALMQRDEAEAKAVRARHAGVLEPSIPAHGGRLLQSFGDGTLSVFPSVVEAVACAVEIQRELQTYPKIPLRIGIHVGDISYDDRGVYGDAVNVASRLESIGTAGSVLVSGKVAEELKNHTRFAVVHQGEVLLKNVERPVALYAIAADGIEVPEGLGTREASSSDPQAPPIAGVSSPQHRPRRGWWLPAVFALGAVMAGWFALQFSKESARSTRAGRQERPSIAVLPFDNLSPDPDNAYFAAGMHEQVISQLSKISGLLVISRNSVMEYADHPKNTTEIAADLGVDFILEGSARRDRDRVRLTAQLIDGLTDEHLWAEDYDRDLSVAGLFEIQDEVADRVSVSLSATILPNEADEIGARPTESLVAYQYYLQGMAISDFFERDNVYRAESLFEGAVGEDPTFALGWAELATARAWLVWRHLDASKRLSTREALDRAVSLDPDHPRVRLAAGQAHLLVTGDLDRAQSNLETASLITPDDPAVLYWLGVLRKFQGRFEEAILFFERARTFDPRNALAAADAGVMYWELRRFADAERSLQIATVLEPTARVWHNYVFYFHLWGTGDTARARAFRDDLLSTSDYDEPQWWAIDLAYLRRDYDQAIELLLERKPPGGSLESPGLGHAPWEALAPQYLRLAGNLEASREHADALTRVTERVPTERAPSDYVIAWNHMTSGLRHAYRGESQNAARDATEAVRRFPLTRNLFGAGPRLTLSTAQIFVLVEMEDRAIDLLEQLLAAPVGVWLNTNLLRLDPFYDSLRDNPRFQAMLDEHDRRSN